MLYNAQITLAKGGGHRVQKRKIFTAFLQAPSNGTFTKSALKNCGMISLKFYAHCSAGIFGKWGAVIMALKLALRQAKKNFARYIHLAKDSVIPLSH